MAITPWSWPHRHGRAIDGHAPAEALAHLGREVLADEGASFGAERREIGVEEEIAALVADGVIVADSAEDGGAPAEDRSAPAGDHSAPAGEEAAGSTP